MDAPALPLLLLAAGFALLLAGHGVRAVVRPRAVWRGYVTARAWMFRGGVPPEPGADGLLAVRLLGAAELVLPAVLAVEEVEDGPGAAGYEARRLAAVVRDVAGVRSPRDPGVLDAALDRLVAELCAEHGADRFCPVLAPDAYRGRFRPAADLLVTGHVEVRDAPPAGEQPVVCLTLPTAADGPADLAAGPCPP